MWVYELHYDGISCLVVVEVVVSVHDIDVEMIGGEVVMVAAVIVAVRYHCWSS